MAKIILGITGEMGSGKGTIASYVVEQKNGSSHRFSTILRDILNRVYVEQTRDNLQALSTVLRKTFGEDLMAKGMAQDAQNDDHDVVVVDGVRRMSDITFLRELPHFKLIYVEADMRKRYERIMTRGENADDSRKTFEEFQKAHEDESELQIKDLKQYASHVINNDGTYEDLYKQIDDIISESLQ